MKKSLQILLGVGMLAAAFVAAADVPVVDLSQPAAQAQNNDDDSGPDYAAQQQQNYQ